VVVANEVADCELCAGPEEVVWCLVTEGGIAASDLARLLAGRGERALAADPLMPVYGWFTEGFDTADLQEAKTLLDALA
jgi:hypothetical protein